MPERETIPTALDEIAIRVKRDCLFTPGAAAESAFENPWSVFLPPSWQASLWTEISPGKRALIGHVNRIHNHLVANWHVLSAVPLKKIEVVIAREGKPEHVVSADTFKWQTLCGDIAYAFCGDKNLPNLKNADIVHVDGTQLVQIATDLPNNNASIGMLVNHPTCWGLVEYSGKTRGGFSGAGYYHGTKLYGIHTHGGAATVGYSASYIRMHLLRAESSDYAALMYMLDKSNNRRYRSTRVSPEEYEIEYRGRYYRIELDEAEELFDTYEEWYDEYEPARRPPPSQRTRRSNWRRRSEESLDLDDDYEVEFEMAPEVNPEARPIPAPRSAPSVQDLGSESGNSRPPTPMGGRPLMVDAAIQSRPRSLVRVRSVGTSPMRESTSGPSARGQQSSAASRPIRNIREEQRRELDSLQPQNAHQSRPSTTSGTQSATQRASRSRPVQTSSGGQSSRRSTGRVRRAWASSNATRPTQPSSVGMESVLRTNPTTRPLSLRCLEDSRPLPRVDISPELLLQLANVGVQADVLRALRTLSSSSN